LTCVLALANSAATLEETRTRALTGAAEAARWFRQAADQGNAEAQSKLRLLPSDPAVAPPTEASIVSVTNIINLTNQITLTNFVTRSSTNLVFRTNTYDRFVTNLIPQFTTNIVTLTNSVTKTMVVTNTVVATQTNFATVTLTDHVNITNLLTRFVTNTVIETVFRTNVVPITVTPTASAAADPLAASRGDAAAQFQLGLAYLRGQPLSRDAVQMEK
jgi:hypothetical protein